MDQTGPTIKALPLLMQTTVKSELSTTFVAMSRHELVTVSETSKNKLSDMAWQMWSFFKIKCRIQIFYLFFYSAVTTKHAEKKQIPTEPI